MKVERHKTAIQRGQLSRPVIIALRDNLLDTNKSFFDYGCGHGQDLDYLKAMGIQACGWDPVFAPDAPKMRADVVNLGYVINVVEDPAERKQTLQSAFSLANKVLVVSAMVGFRDRGGSAAHSDGVLTSRGTFQKYFEQAELSDYISATLGRDAYPAGLGVFYVFADDVAEQRYCSEIAQEQDATNSMSAIASITMPAASLGAIAAQVIALQRLPHPNELPEHGIALGILASSDNWLERLSGHVAPQQLQQVKRLRRQELLIKIAASNYAKSGRLRLADLSIVERADVRAIFGSLSRAHLEADRLLRTVMNVDQVAELCRTWGAGKLTPSAHYVHISMLEACPFELKILVRCAQALIGEELSPTVNIVKINHRQLGITFGEYADFDEDPHPKLLEATRVDFETSVWATRDYRCSQSPPILHRKDLLVGRDYPYYSTFARLTEEEEALDLLGRRDIGALQPWLRLLARTGVKLNGHTIERVEPYELPELSGAPDGNEDDEPDIELPRSKTRGVRSERKAKEPRWPDETLDALAEAVMRLGRPPLPAEMPTASADVKRFFNISSWPSLLGQRFNLEVYEDSRRERWNEWIVRLGSEPFRLNTKTKLKQLDDSAKADIKAFFGNYRQALAEAEQWLKKIGSQDEIRGAIASWPWGLHNEEKGLYLHSSLEPRLPVLLRLLIACAKFMAWDCLPSRIDVIRFGAQGESVKLYKYEGFDEPGPAKCLESVIVDFRRRRVIPRTYERRVKLLEEKHLILPPQPPKDCP